MDTGWDDLAELEVAQEAQRENLMLLDGNNVAYRYIKRANYNSFTEDYIRTIESLARSYDAKRVIICYDFGKSYYRNEVYPEYKDNRSPPKDPEEKQKYDEFFECLNYTISILPERGIEFYKFRGVEADDLIAFFVQNLSDNYEHTWIISSDRDLYQLLEEDVSIFNMFSRKEITLASLKEDKDCSPEEHMLAKVIEGDKGDNIFGIEGIGEKRALAIAKQYHTLDKLVAALPIKGSKAKYIANLNAGKDKLLLNEKLINLIDYNQEAIETGKEEADAWLKLQAALTYK